MSLEDQFFRKSAESKFSNEKDRRYLPEGCINELVTEAKIKEYLEGFITVSELKMLVEFIEQKAKKIFAIISLNNFRGNQLYQAMKQFQKHDFVDDLLPIFSIEDNPMARIRDAFSDDILWNLWRKHEFKDKQWMFLVPVFTEHQLIYKLEQDCILPFKSVSSQTKEGTFGDVFEVEIHEAHQKGEVFMVNGKRANVAVKEIVARGTDTSTLNDVKEAWNIEATALSKINQVKHENLIQCLGAITRGEKHYFLFPWADGGSLREFWKSVPNPSLTPEFIRQIIIQLCGLAGALDRMHSYEGGATVFRESNESGIANEKIDLSATYNAASGSGGIRHGDLKPENILRFTFGDSKGIGTLKIADMGLAKHHNVNTRLRKNLTSTKYGTARYEPPEVGAPRLTSPATSRLYDSWSMGCIILELIIWLLYGHRELVVFYDSIENALSAVASPYYVLEDVVGQGKVAKMHPSVTHRISQLSKDKACSRHTALGDLLKIVETELLVVPLPPSRTTTVNENVSITPAPSTETDAGQYRATASVLCGSLKDILGKAQNDDGYLYAGNDRTISRRLLQSPKTRPPSGLHPDLGQGLGEGSKDASTIESSLVVATRMKENPVGAHQVC